MNACQEPIGIINTAYVEDADLGVNSPGSTATIATNGGQANSNVSFVAGAQLY